jgi:sec-independent protein translocase protein TatC
LNLIIEFLDKVLELSFSDFIKGYEKHFKELASRLRRVAIIWFISLLLMLSLPASALNPESFVEGIYIPLSVYLLNMMISNIMSSPFMKGCNITFIAGHLSMGFEVWFSSSLFFSLLITIPALIYELWKFIEPGLYEHEKKMLKKLFLPIVGCFIFGCLFAFFILVPVILKAFILINLWFNVQSMITYADLINFIVSTIIFSGAFMTTPIIMYGLILVGILPIEPVLKYRIPLYIVVYIIAAIITPDGGPVADIILAAPVLCLFELALQLAKAKRKKSK